MTEPLEPATPNAEDSLEGPVGPERRRMPVERRSRTYKVEIQGFEFYLTAGTYDDGTLGEIFIKDIGKEGSTIQGVLDWGAAVFSIALQHGAKLDMMARKFSHMRFEPNGTTNDPEVPWCSSPIDYLMRRLARTFGSPELNADLDRIAAEMRKKRRVS